MQLSKRICAFGLISVFACCVAARAAEDDSDDAAEKPAPIVATQPPVDDPDYPLLGEFLGPIAVGENQYEPLGLQVRPIGEDDFEALMCPGGLPGAESFTGETTKL